MNENDSMRETSLKSLIECVANDEASAAQMQELQDRLLEDERARNEYLEYMNLHASLRGWFLAENGEASLDTELAELPLLLSREGLQSARTRSSRPWLAAFFVVSCVLLAFVIYQAPWFRQPDSTLATDLPLVVRVVGDVRVKTASGSSRNMAVGESPQVGDTLFVEDDDEVVLRYRDGTEIELDGTSRLMVGQSAQSGKQLELRSGTLQADVAAQAADRPLLIITPHARVLVLGTRFELATDSETGTRLDLESGRVELLRGIEKPLAVESNSVAIIPSTSDPIRVTPRPAVIDSPRREAAFPGIKSARFSADGSTIMAATRWQAVYWHDDNRLEALPFSPKEKKGISFKCQSDSLLAFEGDKPRTLTILDAQSRAPTHVFKDYAGLPRKVDDNAERPKGWKPPANVSALSPKGNWVAFRRGRLFRLWNADQQRWSDYAARYDGKPMQAMASSTDGRLLAIAIRRTTIDVMNPLDGEIVVNWPIRHEAPTSLAFSADGQRLAAGFAGHLRIYDVACGEELATFEQTGLLFLHVALSPDGRLVATSDRGRVRMWDVNSQSELPILDAGDRVLDLAFAADGKRLVVVAKGRMSVWQVAVEESEIHISKSEADSK